MELSDSVVEGVQVAGSSSFDENSFQNLLKSSLECILDPCMRTAGDKGGMHNAFRSTLCDYCVVQVENTDAAYKEALFGLCTFLLELARLDVDTGTIR